MNPEPCRRRSTRRPTPGWRGSVGAPTSCGVRANPAPALYDVHWNCTATRIWQTRPSTRSATRQRPRTASRDRRVFRTDYVAATAGWRVAQHLEDLARALHPVFGP